MAKTFNKVYLVAKETAYAKLDNVLTLIGATNPVVQFTPSLKPGQIIGATPDVEYLIQRPKRIKGSETTANHSPGSTTDELALLDSFKTPVWETLNVGTGKLQTIGVKVGMNEKFDADNLGSVHAKVIADMVDNRAERRIELALEMIVAGTTPSAISPAAFTGKTLRKFFIDEVNKIKMLVDDYKHNSSQVVIFINPLLTPFLEEEIGTVFNQEAPIYKTGLKSRFSISGNPVIELPSLNKVDTAADIRLAAIVMDAEAFAFDASGVKANIDTTLGITRYYGEAFYEIGAVVDSARIATFTATKAELSGIAVTKKVNA